MTIFAFIAHLGAVLYAWLWFLWIMTVLVSIAASVVIYAIVQTIYVRYYK